MKPRKFSKVPVVNLLKITLHLQLLQMNLKIFPTSFTDTITLYSHIDFYNYSSDTIIASQIGR